MVSSRVGGFLALVSGLIASISVFLVWISMTVDLGIFGSYTTNTTGWSVFSDGNVDYYIFPLLILIIGLVVVLFSLFGLAGMKNVAPAKVMGALILLLGVACVGLTAYFYFEGVIQPVVDSGLINTEDAMKFFPMGSGIIAAIIAGVLMVVSGIMGLFANSSD